MPEPLLIAKSKVDLCLLPGYANRHGLIAGATGTGKTVTLQRLAEGLSRIGVPVFMADVKGDLAGLSQAGEAKGKIKERIESLKLKDVAFEACPSTVPWLLEAGADRRAACLLVEGALAEATEGAT